MKETFSNPEQAIITPLAFLLLLLLFCEKDPLKCNINTQKENENHLCKLPKLEKKYAQINTSN